MHIFLGPENTVKEHVLPLMTPLCYLGNGHCLQSLHMGPQVSKIFCGLYKLSFWKVEEVVFYIPGEKNSHLQNVLEKYTKCIQISVFEQQ